MIDWGIFGWVLIFVLLCLHISYNYIAVNCIVLRISVMHNGILPHTYMHHHTHTIPSHVHVHVYTFSCTHEYTYSYALTLTSLLHPLLVPPSLSLPLPLPLDLHAVVGEPPRLMMPQQANVIVYVNNSLGEPQNLVLSCQLVDTTDITFEWFRFIENPESAVTVPTQMVNPATGTLTIHNITEGEYASVDGVNYYCIATRIIGSSNYSASVRSRTITIFYACEC